MNTEEIIVSNIKCGGCISTVENGLKGMQGVQSASVLPDMKAVKVTYENISHEEISKKLSELGYPEAK